MDSYPGTQPRMGFFTDTSVCIGCKACEVACKEWNGVPEDGLALTGMSYDNSVGLGADTWRHVAFIEQQRPASAAGGGDGNGADAAAQPRRRQRAALADVVGRVQALHARRLPGRLPDRGADAHRVRHRRRPGGRLQRLRLLHPRLPVRGHRPAQRRRPRLEVHAVLRPARRGDGAGLRQGVPDGLDPVRAARRAARAAADRSGALHEAGEASARLYGHDPGDGVGGDGAFFLLLDEPEVYGLPPDPVVTTRDLPVDVAARGRGRRDARRRLPPPRSRRARSASASGSGGRR